MRSPRDELIWPAKTIVFLQRLREQGARYLKSLAWLINDSFRVAPRIWFRIFIATLLNLGSNAVVAGAVYTYVNQLQTDAHYDILGLSITARESLPLLVFFIGIMMMAMLTLAASEYVARAAALRLHRQYQEYSLERSLRLLELLPDPRCPQVASIVQTVGVNRLVKTLPHSCSWSLRFIGNGFPSMVVFVAGYAALLWLDVTTTLVVTALGLGVIAAQYPVHLLAARSTNVVEETSPHVNQKLGSLIAFISGFGQGRGQWGLAARLEDYSRDARVIRNADADEDRFRAMELSALSMQTGGGMVLGAMLLTIGSGLLSDSADWAVLLVYLTLLRRLLNSVTAVFRTVTMFSRFSPHVQIYSSFVKGAILAATPVTKASVAPKFLKVAVTGPEGNTKPQRLERGCPFAIFSAFGLDRDLGIAFQRTLFEGQRESTTSMPAIRAVTFSESGRAKAAEAALEAAYPSAAVLLLDRRILAALSEPSRLLWLDRLSDRYVAIVYPTAMEPKYAETLALVRDRADAIHSLTIPAGGLGPEPLKTIDALMRSGEKARAGAAALDEDMG